MKRPRRAGIVGLVLGGVVASTSPADDSPSWRGQVIDPEVGKVCYAVVATDVDADGKIDVVAVANDAVVWYQNPTWQKRDILRGSTEADNVCLQPHDVDGDGQIDFALGSAWRPTDTKTGGTLSIVTRTGAPDGAWRVIPIGAEPTLHRIRWGIVSKPGGRSQLVVAPLQGRNTKGPNWGEGQGSRISVWTIPDRPFDDPWPSETITTGLHTVHNIQVVDGRPLLPRFEGAGPGPMLPPGLLAASWEGVFLIQRWPDQSWQSFPLGEGNQTSRPNRGTSEAKVGRLRDSSAFVATIEPWHGTQFVAYHGQMAKGSSALVRHVIDESIAWGHAVWCADLDGDGDDEVVVGQRDPNPRVDPSRRGPGVIIFDPKPGSTPIAFDRIWVDQGGVAVEDLVVSDLNGDGRPDIVAGGRATHNVKVYWNETRPLP